MAELLEFDALASNVDGTDPGSPLSIMNASYRVNAHSYPAPSPEYVWATSVDTEGAALASQKHQNRVISISVEMIDASGALLRALQAKVTKISRECGTLKRTLTTGQIIIYDLLSSEQFDPTFDIAYYAGNLVKVDLQFGAKPYGRGAAVTLSTHTEATLPCLVFTETAIAGDVPALGKLIISDAQGVDQWFAMWGIQSRYYSSSANAALFYEAEGRTALGGSAIAVGPTGASGAGSNVMRNTALATSYQAVLSTQATGAGAHLSHVGDFRVWARVQVPTTNAGVVSVALQWAEGDFRRSTTNTTVTAGSAGAWMLLDLGIVHPSKVAQGTQQWEGRILAKSTVAGDDIDIDYLAIVPVTEGYGEARAVATGVSPVAFLARDEFNQTAGALNTKVAPIGGTWATSGAATDFQVATAALTRASVNDGSLLFAHGRFAVLGATNYTNVAVAADIAMSTYTTPSLAFQMTGVMARYVDSSNYLFAGIEVIGTPATGSETIYLNVWKVIAGTPTALGSLYLGRAADLDSSSRRVSVRVDTAGRWFVWLGNPTDKAPVLGGQDAALATAGTLATGKPGLYDVHTATVSAITRTITNFNVWAPVTDAAIFASQSLEVRHDQVIREDSGGTIWQTPSSYEGNYLRLPPAGAEGRTLRVFVKASRTDPDTMPDPALDDITAQLVYVPRYLVVPS